jgi:hypothetical protein
MPQPIGPRVPLFPPPREPVSACHRNPASPADQALTAIVAILAWPQLQVLHPVLGRRRLSADQQCPAGSHRPDHHQRWRHHPGIQVRPLPPYQRTPPHRRHRAPRPRPHQAPARTALQPHPTDPARSGPPALTRHGLTAAIIAADDDIGLVLTVTNPAQPCRGTITMTSDGELQWATRTPCHPDGGIPIPDIATAITRALARAEHPAIRPRNEEPA